MRIVLEITALLIFVVAVLVVPPALHDIAQAKPEEQIDIDSDRPVTVKDVTNQGTVGNCDLYLATIDIPNRPDEYQVFTVCGEDRLATSNP